jgi:hypothetical protein
MTGVRRRCPWPLGGTLPSGSLTWPPCWPSFVDFRLPDLAAVRVVAFRLPDLAAVLAFFVNFRLPDLATGRVVAFRLPDLADVLAFVVDFRLPDLATGRAVAFRLAHLADVLAFFAAVVLAIDCPFIAAFSSQRSPCARRPAGGRCAVFPSGRSTKRTRAGDAPPARHATLGAAAAFCLPIDPEPLGRHAPSAGQVAAAAARRRRCSRRHRQEPR